MDVWHAMVDRAPDLLGDPIVSQLQRQLSQYDFAKACATVKMWVQILSRPEETLRGNPSESDR